MTVSQEQIRERDMDRCIRCGQSDGLHVHHRRLRSQGGPSTWANQVTLCTVCHSWVHAKPVAAHAAGLILWAGEEPADVQVAHWCWPAAPIWLNEDSTVTLVRGDDETSAKDAWEDSPW